MWDCGRVRVCIEVIVKVCGRVGGEGGCMRVLPSPPTCHCQMSPLPSHLSFSHDPPLPSLSLYAGLRSNLLHTAAQCSQQTVDQTAGAEERGGCTLGVV